MPVGNTIVIASTSTAPAGTQAAPATTDHFEGCQYRVHNAGNAVCHIAYAATNTAAANAAVGATAGSPTAAIPIPAGVVEILTAPRNSYWSSNSAVNCTVYITPGTGF
jgi:hypothetical protein